MEAVSNMSTEFETMEKKLYDQAQLLHISKALNSELNLSSLIESILDISLAQSQTMQIGIYLYPEVDKHDFVLHDHLIGFDVKDHSKFIISEKNSIIQYMEENNGVFEVSQLNSITRSMREDFREIVKQFNDLNSELLVVPLKSKGKVNGVMVLGTKNSGDSYMQHEKDFLLDLASIAAIAVANARLYELATVDMMTKLKMHHFFQIKLRENMQMKQNGDQDFLSIFLTDVDHFKKFNDTYGHQLGDLVLKEVARVLSENCRDTDIACRYGGEEFITILPNTGLSEASSYAERVRVAIEKMEVENPTDVGEKILKVTISAGVAEYTLEKDNEPKELIERCDKALYEAKHAGRNQVVNSS